MFEGHHSASQKSP